MLKQLMARGRLWVEALAGMDDPEGEYLIELDRRVRKLTAEVEQLRSSLPADATPAVTPTSAPKHQ
jgi:hypothetical protein